MPASRTRSAVLAASLVFAALQALSPSAQARTLEVGEGKAYKMPSLAAAARDGDLVKIYPGEYFDCAVWKANKLVVEGVGDADKVVISDVSCDGKALFITIGADVTIRNLTLTRARVADTNGAGIRGEGQMLLVEGVRFINNENGILTGLEGSIVIVRDSVFERNGTCEKACGHGIYVGNSKLLRVERSRFSDTRRGHHIKSRAERTELVGNTITDGSEGTASYLIDIPNGGSIVARDNTMEKGRWRRIAARPFQLARRELPMRPGKSCSRTTPSSMLATTTRPSCRTSQRRRLCCAATMSRAGSSRCGAMAQ